MNNGKRDKHIEQEREREDKEKRERWVLSQIRVRRIKGASEKKT